MWFMRLLRSHSQRARIFQISTIQCLCMATTDDSVSIPACLPMLFVPCPPENHMHACMSTAYIGLCLKRFHRETKEMLVENFTQPEFTEVAGKRNVARFSARSVYAKMRVTYFLLQV